MGKIINILIVEDRPDKACLIKTGLIDTFGLESVSILVKDKVSDAEEILHTKTNHFQLIALDGDLNDRHGDELIPTIHKTQHGCIIAACSDRPEMNLRMMKAGASITTEKDFANNQFAEIRKNLFELVMKTTTA